MHLLLIFVFALTTIGATRVYEHEQPENGMVNEQREWYMVKLAVSEAGQCSVCTGSFIGTNWILTAAHCIHGADSVVANVGPLFDGNSTTSYNISNSNFVIHPSFAFIKGGRGEISKLSHDIALIQCTPEMSCDHIVPLRLPGKNVAEFHRYSTILFRRFGSSCEQWPPKLIGYPGSCTYCSPNDRYLAPMSGTDEQQLCFETAYEDACSGDTSGHLFMPTTGVLIGFMSQPPSRYCGKHNRILFTRVKFYIPWIENVTGINQN